MLILEAVLRLLKNKSSMDTKLNQTIITKNNLTLGFAEFGDDDGIPVFHFHGHGNSRIEGEMFDEAATNNNIRLIVPDRPGYGLSDFYKHNLLDWPRTIVELADALNIEKFSIMGISGGCPYVLASNHLIYDKIINSAIISTIGPPRLGYNTLPSSMKLSFFMAHRLPWLYGKMLQFQIKKMDNPEELMKLFQKNAKRMPAGDIKLLNNPDFLDLFIRMKYEGSKQGVGPSVYETKLFASDWGFDLSEIQGDKITFWHGVDDPGFGVVQLISDLINGINTKYFENEGHVSIAVNNADEIMKSLL